MNDLKEYKIVYDLRTNLGNILIVSLLYKEITKLRNRTIIASYILIASMCILNRMQNSQHVNCELDKLKEKFIN